MVEYRSRAPVRISFAGGGTDVSPYCEEHGGCVVSATVNKYAWTSLRFIDREKIILEDTYNELKEYPNLSELMYDGNLDLMKVVLKHFQPSKGLDVYMRNDIPPRSGLGSSASAFVSLIGLFNKINDFKLTDYEIAELAYRLERDELGNRGGRQDQYAAVFGGLNFIEFNTDGSVRVDPIRLKRDHFLELEKNLVLVYTMDRSVSGDIIEDQTEKYVGKKKATLEGLEETKNLALDVNQALMCGDLTEFGCLLHKAWESKKKFSKLITNRKIDGIYKAARKNGALGGKISGAGGGGHMILYCESGREEAVSESLENLGARVVPFTLDRHGLESWEI